MQRRLYLGDDRKGDFLGGFGSDVEPDRGMESRHFIFRRYDPFLGQPPQEQVRLRAGPEKTDVRC
jgi:hypothetical protein